MAVSSSRKLADFIAQAAIDKKAEDVVILDLRKLDTVCDYFVICTGEVDQQVRAIANHIEDTVREKTHEKVFGREGKVKLDWVLLDYVDVVVHIFRPSTRQFYRLEDLWGDSELIQVSDSLKIVRKPRTVKKETTSAKSAKTVKPAKEKVVKTKTIRKPKTAKPTTKPKAVKKTVKKTPAKAKS